MRKAAQVRLQCRTTLFNTGTLIFRRRYTLREIFSRTSQSQLLNPRTAEMKLHPGDTTKTPNRSVEKFLHGTR